MANAVESRPSSPSCTLLGCDGFSIKLREDAVSVTVTVTGEVDLATAPMLMRALELAAVGDPDVVVVDAAELTFIGTYGLGVILGARQALRERSGRLLIRNPSSMLRRTLAITRLTDLAGS